LLRQNKALSLWDYSCAAPYAEISMARNAMDAVFLSGHRMLGAVGSPGVLVAKKALFENYVPTLPGNGTLFVSHGVGEGEYVYLDNVEEREEAGTVDLTGAVRLALAFMLKDRVSVEFISARHAQNVEMFLQETASVTNLKLIGRPSETLKVGLPVLAFEIKYKHKFLHYAFVMRLMNDLFGVQGCGGHGDAGVFCKHALELTDEEMQHMVKQMSRHKNELSRPGFYRLFLHWSLKAEEVRYIARATRYVCEHGWKFCPLYDIDKESGSYHRRDEQGTQPLRSLLDVRMDAQNGLTWRESHLRQSAAEFGHNFERYFELADRELANLKKILPTKKRIGLEKKVKDKHAWYWLPSELFPFAVEHAFKDVINQKRKQ